MINYYIHPFLQIQRDGDASIAFLSSNPRETCIRIFDKQHPLFGILRPADILERLALLSDADRDILTKLGYLSVSPVDAEAELAEISRSTDSPDHFTLNLFPTLNCNNSCRYCYEKHRRQPRMSDEDFRAVLLFIGKLTRRGVRTISLGLLGGEPTLESRRLLPFLAECTRTCRESGIDLSVELTTNGRLLGRGDLANKFVGAGANKFQVTLDGPRRLHNQSRPGITGRPTFDAVIEGISALRRLPQQDIHCIIRINHSRRSILPSNLLSYHRILSRLIGGDPRFAVAHTRAADLGGNPEKEALLSRQEYEDTLPRLIESTLASHLLIREDIYTPGGRVCYAALRNSIVVLPGRRLLKCTTALDDPRNQVGILNDIGEMDLNDNFKMWVADVSVTGKCVRCSSSPICQGKSCPLNRIRTGRPHCPIDLTESMNYFAWVISSDRNREGLLMRREASWN